MEEAKEKLENLTEDSVFIGLYDAELEREREQKDKMAYAEKKGLERGIEKGLEKGIEQGSINTKFETAKKMKEEGLSFEMISRVTSLPIEKIEQL